MLVQNMLLWYIDYFELKGLKNSICRERFDRIPLICLQTESPKGTQLSQILSLEVSSTREDGLLFWERLEQTPPLDKLGHKLSHLPCIV